jgi:hypothetical protein
VRTEDRPACLLDHLRRDGGSRLAGAEEGSARGGHDRDRIVRHTKGAEIEEIAKKVGVRAYGP